MKLKSATTEILIAAPGTGKTTTLLNRIEQALGDGVSPMEIAFFSFSNTAVNEGLNRITQRLGLKKNQFRYFRTLHSMAFSLLGMSTSQIMSFQMQRKFAAENDLKLAIIDFRTGAIKHQTEDSVLLSQIDSARLQGMTVREYFVRNHLEDVEKAEALALKYQHFKLVNGVIDFTDMILFANEQEIDTPHFKYMFIDEAQDLSRQQWAFVEKLSENTENIVIVGDERQAIAEFAGADVDTFLSIEGKQTILNQSYRVPTNIWRLARKIEKHMKKTRGAEWKPRAKEFNEQNSGEVIRVNQIPAREMARGTWLVLTRTNAQLDEFKRYIMQYCNTLPTFFTVDGQAPVDTDIFKAIHVFEAANRSTKATRHDFITIEDDDDDETRKVKTEFIMMFKKFMSSTNPYTPEVDKVFRHRFDYVNWFDAFDKVSIMEKRYVKAIKDAFAKNPKAFDNAKIKLSTIHSAKGMEAENVLLYTVLTGKVYNEWQQYKDTNDTEAKVLFVGVTRARKRLFLLSGGPKNKMTYEEMLK